MKSWCSLFVTLVVFWPAWLRKKCGWLLPTKRRFRGSKTHRAQSWILLKRMSSHLKHHLWVVESPIPIPFPREPAWAAPIREPGPGHKIQTMIFLATWYVTQELGPFRSSNYSSLNKIPRKNLVAWISEYLYKQKYSNHDFHDFSTYHCPYIGKFKWRPNVTRLQLFRFMKCWHKHWIPNTCIISNTTTRWFKVHPPVEGHDSPLKGSRFSPSQKGHKELPRIMRFVDYINCMTWPLYYKLVC